MFLLYKFLLLTGLINPSLIFCRIIIFLKTNSKNIAFKREYYTTKTSGKVGTILNINSKVWDTRVKQTKTYLKCFSHLFSIENVKNYCSDIIPVMSSEIQASKIMIYMTSQWKAEHLLAALEPSNIAIYLCCKILILRTGWFWNR